MTNPHEYREVMKAAVGYSDETVEQVLARQKSKAPRAGKKGEPPAPAQVRPSELKKLNDLISKGKPHPAPPKE